MHGSIRRDGPSEQAAFAHYVAGGLASTAEYRYAFEHKKDLANHVWAVALHCPDTKITVDADGKPTDLPWTLEGVHEASGNALARGKMLWRETRTTASRGTCSFRTRLSPIPQELSTTNDTA
jgi:hypothetical protein